MTSSVDQDTGHDRPHATTFPGFEFGERGSQRMQVQQGARVILTAEAEITHY